MTLTGSMLADGATFLLLTSMGQLLVGNILIGWLEGLLLARIFELPRKQTIWIMVLANYASMILMALGTWGIKGIVYPWLIGDEPLYHVVRLLAVLWGASYILTLLIEWPFCYWALQTPGRSFKRSLLASVIAQSASYLLLVPLYLLVGQPQLVTQFTADRSFAANGPNDALVFFVSERDRAICQINVDGSGLQRLQDVPDGRVSLTMQSRVDPNEWWLLAQNYGYTKTVVQRVAYDLRRTDIRHCEEEFRSHHYGPAYDYRPEAERQWRVMQPHWSCIECVNVHTREKLTIAMELPFETWLASSATVLPGERVVFCMNGQILLADLNKRRVMLLALGDSPIVIPREAIARAATQPTSE